MNPTFGIGSQNDRIIGTAIDNLDKTSDQESSRFQLDQRRCSVHRLSDQGTLPEGIPVLINAFERHPVPENTDQIRAIFELNQ